MKLFTRTSTLRRATVVAAVVASIAATVQPSGAASSGSTVVGATVPSSTQLSLAACQPGVANVTEFGSLTGGQLAVTSANCAVSFGSSNDTARLRIAQADGRGAGMWRRTSGALDPTYGDGRIEFDSGHADQAQLGSTLALAPDGTAIAVGTALPNPFSAYDGLIIRGTPTGGIDNTLDGDGRLQVDLGSTTDSYTGVAIAANGDSFASRLVTGAGVMRVERRTPAGVLVGGFGTAGIATVDATAGEDRAIGVHLDPAGRVLLSGIVDVGASNWGMVVARLNATTGALDTSFGAAGLRQHSVTGSTSDFISDVAIQPDGKLLLAGYSNPGGGGIRMTIVRLTADGNVDSGFGVNGERVLSPGVGTSSANDVAVLPDGRIVLAGSSDPGSGVRATLALLTSSGAVDNSFSGDGIATFSPGTAASNFTAVTAEPDGTILAVGTATQAGTGDDVLLTRVGTSGSLDTSLDGDGILLHAASAAADSAADVALDADGKPVLFATMGGGTLYDMALLRLETTTVSQYANGVSDWDQGTNAFGACLASVAGGAVATWAVNATCPATDGAHWNPVPTSATEVASTPTGVTGATANLRFGFRVASSQAPGRYLAPVTFEVLAPDA